MSSSSASSGVVKRARSAGGWRVPFYPFCGQVQSARFMDMANDRLVVSVAEGERRRQIKEGAWPSPGVMRMAGGFEANRIYRLAVEVNRESVESGAMECSAREVDLLCVKVGEGWARFAFAMDAVSASYERCRPGCKCNHYRVGGCKRVQVGVSRADTIDHYWAGAQYFSTGVTGAEVVIYTVPAREYYVERMPRHNCKLVKDKSGELSCVCEDCGEAHAYSAGNVGRYADEDQFVTCGNHYCSPEARASAEERAGELYGSGERVMSAITFGRGAAFADFEENARDTECSGAYYYNPYANMYTHAVHERLAWYRFVEMRAMSEDESRVGPAKGWQHAHRRVHAASGKYDSVRERKEFMTLLSSSRGGLSAASLDEAFEVWKEYRVPIRGAVEGMTRGYAPVHEWFDARNQLNAKESAAVSSNAAGETTRAEFDAACAGACVRSSGWLFEAWRSLGRGLTDTASFVAWCDAACALKRLVSAITLE